MFRRHAVRHPHVARTAEIVPGHQQQLVFARAGAEGAGVRFGRFHKQIKRSVGIHAGIALFRQTVIEKIPVSPINAKIRRFTVAFGRYALKQGGGAYEPEDAPRAAYGRIQGLIFRRAGTDRDIADPLAGEGEGF